MNIDAINRGIVLDHIKAGKAMEIYRHLHLDALSCSVAIIKNVKSRVMGHKDIIKVDEKIDLDLAILGYIDPGITINIIDEGSVTEKKHIELPQQLTNVIQCHNPRCITTSEQAIDQIFILKDKQNGVYRCVYCETENQSG
jgi:aspartate carbamoyltransferase regulatory subunit